MRRTISILRAAACLIAAAGCVMAHDPHDPIAAVAISPNYVNDQTVFAATSYLSVKVDAIALLKSTNAGVSWTVVSGLPKDSEILEIVFSPAYGADQTVYLAGPGGLFRSTDAGTSWATMTSKSLVFVALSASFGTDNTLFAVSADTITKSTDRGQTWASLPLPGSLTSSLTLIAISPNYAADQTLLLGTAADGIFESNNGGANWTEATAGLTLPAVTSLAFSPNYAGDETAFAATYGAGVLISTNGGTSWTASNSGITDLDATWLALSPQYAQDSTLWITTAVGGVFGSTTAGASWNAAAHVSRPLSNLSSIHYQAVAASAGSGGPLLYLGMFEGLWTSRDGGSSWQYIDTFPTRLIRYINVSPNYTEDQTIFASTYGGGNLWSVTGGTTWTFQNTGMQLPYTDASGISPNFAADGIAFSGNANGLQRTSNRGATWQMPAGLGVPAYPRALGISPAFKKDSTVLIGLALPQATGTPGAHGSCGATADPTGRSQTVSGLYRSTNRGNTWLTTNISGVTSIFSIAMSPAFSSDGTAFAASQTNGLYESTDGGMTWAAVTSLPAPKVVLVAVSPSFATDNTLFAASMPGGFYRSANRGSTWSLVSGTGSLRILSMQVSPNYAVDQCVFAGTAQKGLVRFKNGGTTMVAMPGFTDEFVTAVSASPNFAKDRMLFAAGYHGLFKSTDSGVTWTNTGAPARIEESQNIAGPLNEPPTIIYQGAWTDVTQSAVASTAAYMSTAEQQDAAILTFWGSGIGWVTWTGPTQGSASILLDGVSQATVTLTAPVDLYQQLIWQTQGLVCGVHSLSITALPETGQSVSLDAFNVWVNDCPQQ